MSDNYGDDVDTKRAELTILVTTGPSVVTKHLVNETFGNYGLQFVRVRKRALKGGHSESRWWRARDGILASSATSFDVVRAVRVNGKPRHQFVFGLGSLKDKRRSYELPWFWYKAFRNMRWVGLNVEQRRALANELMRKGAPPLSPSDVQRRFEPEDLPEILSWFAGKVAA